MATTSNMGLTLPDVSVTLGPTWASQINSDLTLLDQHNHTSGFGVQIPTAGLNIDGDLGFNNHAISGLSYLKLNPQAATLETSSLYVDSAGDFFTATLLALRFKSPARAALLQRQEASPTFRQEQRLLRFCLALAGMCSPSRPTLAPFLTLGR